ADLKKKFPAYRFSVDSKKKDGMRQITISLIESPLEIALLFACNGSIVCKRVFTLNPLTDTILYHESAAQVHGVSEDTIRAYPPAEKVIPEIAAFFYEVMEHYRSGGKMVFAGYNCSFDWNNLQALFTRCNEILDDYFSTRFDVMEMAKKAAAQKLIPYQKDFKLGTLCKSLGVPLENAHSALADIQATRNLCIELYKRGGEITCK
ncbi:MAG: exonuclease domain-containing protein, partial [Treponema sp.]